MLAADRATLQDALPHLERAAAEIPAAHLNLAYAYALMGNRSRASGELEKYHTGVAPAQRAAVERQIASFISGKDR